MKIKLYLIQNNEMSVFIVERVGRVRIGALDARRVERPLFEIANLSASTWQIQSTYYFFVLC
jgi:hypothetical protein